MSSDNQDNRSENFAPVNMASGQFLSALMDGQMYKYTILPARGCTPRKSGTCPASPQQGPPPAHPALTLIVTIIIIRSTFRKRNQTKRRHSCASSTCRHGRAQWREENWECPHRRRCPAAGPAAPGRLDRGLELWVSLPLSSTASRTGLAA